MRVNFINKISYVAYSLIGKNENASCPLDQLLASQLSNKVASEYTDFEEEQEVEEEEYLEEEEDKPLPSTVLPTATDPYQLFLMSFINGKILNHHSSCRYRRFFL